MARLLVLTVRDLAAIRRHAERAYPEECCGILLGRPAVGQPGATEVEEAVAAANAAAANRRRRYEIAPQELLAAHRRARREGREVVGYYHSHPDRPARPSERDLAAAWPGVSYLIVTVEQGRAGELRSFRLRDRHGPFEEEPWSSR